MVCVLFLLVSLFHARNSRIQGQWTRNSIFFTIHSTLEHLGHTYTGQPRHFHIPGVDKLVAIADCWGLRTKKRTAIRWPVCGQAAVGAITTRWFFGMCSMSFVKLTQSAKRRASYVHLTLERNALKTMHWIKTKGKQWQWEVLDSKRRRRRSRWATASPFIPSPPHSPYVSIIIVQICYATAAVNNKNTIYLKVKGKGKGSPITSKRS